MMDSKRIASQPEALAAPRELSAAEREQALSDPALREQLLRYEAQDALLGGLSAPRLSGAAIGSILQATTLAPARARRGLFGRRWAWSAIALVLVLAIALSGTGYAAAQSLPGDTLYPLKREAEQVRLRLMFNPAQRVAYQAHLGMIRRAEAQRVLAQQRQGVELELDGTLQRDQAGQWSIGGVPVSLPNGAQWEPGMHVQMRGAVDGRHLRVQEMHALGALDDVDGPLPAGTPQGGAYRRGQTAAAATADASEPSATPAPGATPAPALAQPSPEGGPQAGHSAEPHSGQEQHGR